MYISKSIDLSHLYNLRNEFAIIELTCQIRSSYKEVVEQFVKGFGKGKDYENPIEIVLNDKCDCFKHNSKRMYRIIYDYAIINFKGYTLIKYINVLTIFLLQNTIESFVEFIESIENAIGRNKIKN